MPFPKKTKKKWIYFSVVLALVIAAGVFFSINDTSHFSEYFNTNSNCRFNPEINEKNKALIEETIVTVAHEGVFSLMGKEKHLRKIGAIVSNEVSDFAYWAYVFSCPELARDMKIIQKSSLKYKGYITGTRDKLMKDYQENPCLLQQARGFARYLHLPEEQTVAVLKECLDNSNRSKYEFRKYIDYLIENKAH